MRIYSVGPILQASSLIYAHRALLNLSSAQGQQMSEAVLIRIATERG